MSGAQPGNLNTHLFNETYEGRSYRQLNIARTVTFATIGLGNLFPTDPLCHSKTRCFSESRRTVPYRYVFSGNRVDENEVFP